MPGSLGLQFHWFLKEQELGLALLSFTEPLAVGLMGARRGRKEGIGGQVNQKGRWAGRQREAESGMWRLG